MSIYVDPLFATAPSKKWPYTQASHMTADTFEELNTFAVNQLGLNRAWAQCHDPNPRKWHYDLTPNKRKQAVRLGAKEITWEERVQIIQGTYQASKQ